MIEAIRGTILEKHPQRVIVWAGALALEVHIPFSTFGQLPDPGQETLLCCHLHWREDGPQLFGFANEEERALFRLLTRVNKVGPKLALNILSAVEPGQLVTMILSEDTLGLTSLKGVGNKLASRLIVELREPLARFGLPADGRLVQAGVPASLQVPFADEVREALENLGYTSKEIQTAFRNTAPLLPPQADLATVLQEVLRSFGSR